MQRVNVYEADATHTERTLIGTSLRSVFRRDMVVIRDGVGICSDRFSREVVEGLSIEGDGYIVQNEPDGSPFVTIPHGAVRPYNLMPERDRDYEKAYRLAVDLSAELTRLRGEGRWHGGPHTHTVSELKKKYHRES